MTDKLRSSRYFDLNALGPHLIAVRVRVEGEGLKTRHISADRIGRRLTRRSRSEGVWPSGGCRTEFQEWPA